MILKHKGYEIEVDNIVHDVTKTFVQDYDIINIHNDIGIITADLIDIYMDIEDLILAELKKGNNP